MRIDVEEITRERGAELLDEAAQRLLGVSGPEFLAGWDVGGYRDGAGAAEVAMLIPYAR